MKLIKLNPYLPLSIIAFLVVSLIIILNTINFNQPALAEQPEPTIVTENGFKVIEDNDPNRSTIIATIISRTPDKQYYSAVNKYDSEDIVVIDLSEDYEIGDTVYITFNNDDVEKVEMKES